MGIRYDMIRIPDQMRMSRISNQIETRNVKRCSGKVFQESDGSGPGSLSSAVGVGVGVDAVAVIVSFSSWSYQGS